MLRFDLCLLYIFLDEDHKMYTWSCFHMYIKKHYIFEKVLMLVRHGFWFVHCDCTLIIFVITQVWLVDIHENKLVVNIALNGRHILVDYLFNLKIHSTWKPSLINIHKLFISLHFACHNSGLNGQILIVKPYKCSFALVFYDSQRHILWQIFLSNIFPFVNQCPHICISSKCNFEWFRTHNIKRLQCMACVW
jgi:hypothetical protein